MTLKKITLIALIFYILRINGTYLKILKLKKPSIARTKTNNIFWAQNKT